MTEPTLTASATAPSPMRHEPDPERDLVLERVVDVPPELVWAAWTTPELLKQWFTPAPWSTSECELDLRPGGTFRVVMRSPEGEDFPNAGCVLEVVEQEKFAWTGALGPGYRPRSREEPAKENNALLFSAVITLEPHDGGTKYRALVIHADPADAARHGGMGFHQGWGAALDQLVALAKRMQG